MSKVIVKLYYRLVKSGKRTLDEIEDEKVREAVKKLLETENYGEW